MKIPAPPLCLLALFLSGCVVGEGWSQQDKVRYGPSGDGWEEEFVGIVDAEVERLSTYASTEDSWGACVTTWTVGGAVLGEAASKTCMVVGVASFETGVGAVAAAVCVGADAVQADATLGAAAGYVSGYLACSASATFDKYLSGFRIFNIGASEESSDEEDSGLEDYNTPECAAKYDEYKDHCGQPRSCKDQLLSCEQYISRYEINITCAELRNEHLYDCPHPEDYDWDGHKQAVGEAYQSAQRCKSELCDSNCLDFIAPEYYSAYDSICY